MIQYKDFSVFGVILWTLQRIEKELNEFSGEYKGMTARSDE